MWRLNFGLIILLLCFLTACAQAPEVKLGKIAQLTEKNYSQNYALLLPTEGKVDPNSPLLVVISAPSPKPEKWLKLWNACSQAYPFILIFPEFKPGFSNFSQQEDLKLMAIFQELKDTLDIDINHIYLAGVKEGAVFAQRFAMLYPALVKGTALIAGENYNPPNSLVKTVAFLLLADEQEDNFQYNQTYKEELVKNGYQAELLSFKNLLKEFPQKACQLCFEFFARRQETLANKSPQK